MSKLSKYEVTKFENSASQVCCARFAGTAYYLIFGTITVDGGAYKNHGYGRKEVPEVERDKKGSIIEASKTTVLDDSK